MTEALRFTDTQMAMLQGPAPAIAMALIAIPIGLSVDRVSRKWLLVALAGVILIGSAITGVAESLPVLFIV